MGDCYCEVVAIIHLVSVDGKQFFESKMVYKWRSERKPTSPFKLPMLLCDDLYMYEGFKFCFVANSEGYQELQPLMSDFADILIDLCPLRREQNLLPLYLYFSER